MPENAPTPIPNGWVAEWITNGKIPGAAKAIAQLVGDTANAGGAWVNIITVKGQQIQERIKTDTAGYKSVMDALAAEAARQGVTDPALVTLALQQFGSSTIRKYLNKSSVAREGLNHLGNGKPVDDTVGDIDDDWLNKFENLAADASSERMQKLLGKVLSGEIRQPGAYSFATLNFISLMDASVGKSIEALSPYVVSDDYIPFVNRFDFTVYYEHYMVLKDYGLIGDNIRRKFNPGDPTENILLKYRGHAVVMEGLSVPETPIDLMPLTRVGKEIFPLISANVTVEQLRETADLCFRYTTCSSVLIGSTLTLPNGDEGFRQIERKTREQQ